MKIDMALSLPRETRTIPVARHVVVATLHELGVAQSCTNDIELAISEACANVIEHAAVEDEYEIHLSLDHEQCEIRVVDVGGGMDEATLVGIMPTSNTATGRGVLLMRALVDRIDFRSEPEKGTIVHLVKAISFVDGSPLARNDRRPARQ